MRKLTLNSDNHSSTTPWSIANMFLHLQCSHNYLQKELRYYMDFHGF